jgi:hypothetical protein
MAFPRWQPAELGSNVVPALLPSAVSDRYVVPLLSL